MTDSTFVTVSNSLIARDTWRMTLAGDSSGLAPGRFLNILLPGFYLRRPISVCDYSDGLVTIIYKVVGEGTAALSRVKHSEKLRALTGLGNGFDLSRAGVSPLLIGGGAGASPLFALAKRLGGTAVAVLGFNTAREIYYEEEFSAVCKKVIVTTADDSEGLKGLVTEALKGLDEPSYFYACGPEPMLKGVCAALKAPGELSLEARMACGFGVCRGCTIKTRSGEKSVCQDGPVFAREDILWKT